MEDTRFELFESLIGSAAKSIKRLKGLYMDAYALSAAHTSCLYQLLSAQPHGITQTGLTKRLGMDRAQVCRVLRELREKGYVCCGDHPGYKSPYHLTEEGRRICSEIDATIRQIHGYVSAGLPQEDIERFYRTFRVITDHLSEAVALHTHEPKENQP